jgi:GT2 family glycosyltransferase
MIGVVITVYNSADVILDCIESLLAQTEQPLRIVIVDNASPDDSVARLKAWAAGELPYAPDPTSPLGETPAAPKPVEMREVAAKDAGTLSQEPLAAVTILRAPCNLGYAGAVNLGLSVLAAQKEIELLWVLNPDCVVPAATLTALLRAQRAAGPFSLMGSRIIYYRTPDRIHADGGRVGRFSGLCRSLNRGALVGATPPPDPAAIDFVIGANMVVSREFLGRVGPMREDYFLYYEEVDWALRRGDLPLAFAHDAVVYHHGGTAIGTGQLGERPSAFANYFNYRNRMRFMWRFHPWRLPIAYLMSLAAIARSVAQDDAARIAGALRGLHGLPPSPEVARRIGPEAALLAFAPMARSPA